MYLLSYVDPSCAEPQSEYRGLYKSEWGPTPGVLEYAESPLEFFLLLEALDSTDC